MVPWICCQLGAREHYAIPRALFRLGNLEYLLTDAWVPPSSILRIVGDQRPGIGDRWHEELEAARVASFNWSLIAFEMLSRARRFSEWQTIIARNRWFQRKVVSALRSDVGPLISAAPVLLSYSYAALEPFRYAKSRGWKTLLVQIDPGPEEERTVAEEAARVPEVAAGWQPAPPEYWELWREECKLADCIVVNSEWSREGLMREGIPPAKLTTIPLAYERSEGSRLRLATARQRGQKSAAFGGPPASREVGAPRSYPARFTHERPMRVLFLGLINLRKGVARLLEAARRLQDEPIEFWMVGPVEIANTSTTKEAARVKWFGPATRKRASEFYTDADVFILPTLSDGFAITQLEAQAHGLPVVASKNCGHVVENGVNGIILDEPNAACMARALRNCVANPDRLQELAGASGLGSKFSLSSVGQRLGELTAAL
jgi:glycosyltransferase involved in cell wall biosynthesis